jgi:SHAQKYF class myb-like DNA-binding protein
MEDVKMPPLRETKTHRCGIETMEPSIILSPPDSIYHSLFMERHHANTFLNPFPFEKRIGSVTIGDVYQGEYASIEKCKSMKPSSCIMNTQGMPNEGTWSSEEHERFLIGLDKIGRNWTRISKEFVKTRSRTQVASHAQKYFKKLELKRLKGTA